MKGWAMGLLVLSGLGCGVASPAADFDGDGRGEPTIFRRAQCKWVAYGVTNFYFGNSADQVVCDDYDGDGKSDAAIFRAADSMWTVRDITRVWFGSTGDAVVPGGKESFWRANDNGIYFNGAGLLTGDDYVGIGRSDPVFALDVYANEAGNYVARFKSDGHDSNRYGIVIQCGSDEGDGLIAQFRNGANVAIGSITSAGGNVSYNSFTAEHNASIPDQDNASGGYPYGTVVSLRAVTPDPARPRQDRYSVAPSAKPYDAAVFGVYAGKVPEQANLHSIYAVGDGHILVTSEGGDIAAGSFLTTSSAPGRAMRQNDDLRHAYTVAKALAAVDWSKEQGDSVLIPCTYQTQ